MKKPSKATMVRQTFWLDKNDYARLKAISEMHDEGMEADRSIGWFIRRAVRIYLNSVDALNQSIEQPAPKRKKGA